MLIAVMQAISGRRMINAAIAAVCDPGVGRTGTGLGAAAVQPSGPALYAWPLPVPARRAPPVPCHASFATAMSSPRGPSSTSRTGSRGSADRRSRSPARRTGRAWQAAPGAKPVIVGAVLPLSGWATYSGSIQKASVPSGTNTRQLWVNGTREVRAAGQNTTFGSATQNSNGYAATNTAYLVAGRRRSGDPQLERVARLSMPGELGHVDPIQPGEPMPRSDERCRRGRGDVPHTLLVRKRARGS